VLGVSDPMTESGALLLYPNPANDQLFVNYNGQSGEVLKFTVYNMLGEVVRTANIGKTYGASSYAFDLSGIASGVYFVQAECDGHVTSRKFVKQ
jgi:hypothetical protein